MKGEKIGSIYGYALMAVVLLTLGSGCIGDQSGSSDNGQTPPVKATIRELASSSTLAPATTQTTARSQTDFSQVSVLIAGCDSDYYGNAMVAGYVTNNGVRTIDAVPIVTQILTSTGEVVLGGEKTTVINNLKPGERQNFSVVYEKPPQWEKCRASVNGVWTVPST